MFFYSDLKTASKWSPWVFFPSTYCCVLPFELLLSITSETSWILANCKKTVSYWDYSNPPWTCSIRRPSHYRDPKDRHRTPHSNGTFESHGEAYCINANEQKYGIVRAQPLVQLGRKSGLQSTASSWALNYAKKKSLRKLSVVSQIFGKFKYLRTPVITHLISAYISCCSRTGHMISLISVLLCLISQTTYGSNSTTSHSFSHHGVYSLQVNEGQQGGGSFWGYLGCSQLCVYVHMGKVRERVSFL